MIVKGDAQVDIKMNRFRSLMAPISRLLIFSVLIMSVFPVRYQPAFAADANTGRSLNFIQPISTVAGDSIPIGSREELEAISQNMRGKYHLTTNIDLYDEHWIPIGDDVTPF